MDQGPTERRRTEPVRLWVQTVAFFIAAMSPIVVELIRAAGN